VTRATTALLVVLLASPAYGAPCDKAYKMTGGVLTPCTGLLVPLDEAALALNAMQVDLPKCVTQLAAEKNLRQADRTMFLKLMQAEKKRSDDLDALLKTVISPVIPWWESGPFYFAAGLVVGGGLIAGGMALSK
jgi:hypothetical protein